MTAVAEVPKKATKKPPTAEERGFTVLERAQFINVVEIPLLNTRTIWVDVSNRSYVGVEFLYDPKGFVRLEKPGDPAWRNVLIPLTNVAAMFPKE